MEVSRKKNEAGHVTCPLIDQANQPQFQSGATLAAGDVKVCKWTGAAWNVSNIGTLPSEIGSTGVYDFAFTAPEVNPADTQYPVVIMCHDAAGGEWDDQAIVIWTRNNDMDDVALQSLLQAVAEYIDTEVAAIKAVTDNLPDSGALGDLATLAGRLSAARAGYLDNLTKLDYSIGKLLGAMAGKQVGNVAGTEIKFYDRAGALLATRTYDSGTRTWSTAWA